MIFGDHCLSIYFRYDRWGGSNGFITFISSRESHDNASGVLHISDNALATETGPAISINSGDNAFLSGNDLYRDDTAPAFAQNPPQVVSITADNVTISDNNFYNQQVSLDSSISVTAIRITYTSNRSVCENLPTIANVILLGPTQNKQVTGSVVAVGNTCLEPVSAEVSDFEGSLQRLREQQAALVDQLMAARTATERQKLLQELNLLESEGEQFAQRLKVLVSRGNGPASLLASAAFTSTGMNLLSNKLVRLGIGSDQGSVEGVS
jgi:hypothetical protein